MSRKGPSPCVQQQSVETLFTAPDGFFDRAVLYARRRDDRVSDEGSLETVQEFGLGEKSGIKEETEALRNLSVVRDDGLQIGPGVQQGPVLPQTWVCNGCRAVFQSLEEQRAHYKSDVHRFNVKRKVAGKEAVNEDEFEAMIQSKGNRGDDDLSSISGSDTESETDEINLQQQLHQRPRDNRVLIEFLDSKHGILLWRCLLAADKEILPGEKGYSNLPEDRLCLMEDDVLQRLRSLTSADKQSLWVILLAAGGHFAGLVVDTRGGSVIAHQTFHRYVVRAKAGGRQSAHDASGRAPKSAGASLRRYNEQALQKDIRELLSSWREHLQAASHLFVYAPSSNAQTLYGGDNAILSPSDGRIRRIPFTTRRPTMKEAKRINYLLGTLYKVDEDTLSSFFDKSSSTDGVVALRSRGVEGLKNVPPQSKHTSSKKKLGSDEVEKIVTEPLETKIIEEDNAGRTPLHEAAKEGDIERILKLLEEGADPCVKDKGGRAPYALAKDKESRNVFRRFMALHLDKWDWHAANVPSPLTDELEAAQQVKQAEKDAKKKAKEKERKKLRKAEDKVKQAEAKAAEAASKAEEVAARAAANVRYDKNRSKQMFVGSISLDPKSKEYQEAMLKAQAQERETRAAAAEFRLRALSSAGQGPMSSSSNGAPGLGSSVPSNVCSCCGSSLAGKVPFTRFSYQYCSTTCVRVHKMALEE